MENQKQNISISGSGSFNGGEYDQIRISGSGRCQGEVKANDIRVSGAAHLKGVAAETIHISGAGKFEGDLRAREIHVSGSARVTGGAEVSDLHVSGAMHAENGLRGTTARVSGSLHVSGEMEFEEATISGGVHVTGLLNADRLQIQLGGGSNVGEIGGTVINVERSNKNASGFIQRMAEMLGVKKQLFTLSCGSIEGTDVFLEDTTAKSVRGETVVIGPGCRVEEVEYRKALTVDETSEVLHQKQI